MRILITGGAGFVGSTLAMSFRREFPSADIVAFDNLRRRGAELNLPLLRAHRIAFVHGDVRARADLETMGGTFDVVIEASAEPSVHAGLDGSADYLIETNLSGTLNCLALVRRRADRLIFLSTSRVYSLQPLRQLALDVLPTRFDIAAQQSVQGVSVHGINEEFPSASYRSLYGATKLASEMLIQEYVAAYGVRAVSNRCGVIAGPGQFGRTDQGVFSLWVARHLFGGALKYTGFGGFGKQVRDLLHPEDLASLLLRQIEGMDRHSGESFNVGGGRENSVSLSEFTTTCREVVGRDVSVEGVEDVEGETSKVDVPIYISDTRKVSAAFGWAPRRSVPLIVREIHAWLRENEAQLRPLFC